jgi:hypothetical protein
MDQEPKRSRACFNVLSVILPPAGLAAALASLDAPYDAGYSTSGVPIKALIAVGILLGSIIAGCVCGFVAVFRRERLWGITACGFVLFVAALLFIICGRPRL